MASFLFCTPKILRSVCRLADLQDPSGTDGALTCTGISNLSGHFCSDYPSQSGPIASNAPGVWMLERSSNAIYWDIEWRISLTSTGSITLTLNTGFVVLQLEGPTSNQGSWTTSTGQH